MNKSGFNVGDPVMLVSNSAKVGKVVAFCTPVKVSGTEILALPYVVWYDSPMAQVQDILGLRLCKCVNRVPIKIEAQNDQQRAKTAV